MSCNCGLPIIVGLPTAKGNRQGFTSGGSLASRVTFADA
jgi:hypothetical protein